MSFYYSPGLPTEIVLYKEADIAAGLCHSALPGDALSWQALLTVFFEDRLASSPEGGLLALPLRAFNQGIRILSTFFYRGVAKAAFDCTHRTSTIASCAFWEVRDARNNERHVCARRRDGEPAVSAEGILAAPCPHPSAHIAPSPRPSSHGWFH